MKNLARNSGLLRSLAIRRRHCFPCRPLAAAKILRALLPAVGAGKYIPGPTAGSGVEWTRASARNPNDSTPKYPVADQLKNKMKDQQTRIRADKLPGRVSEPSTSKRQTGSSDQVKQGRQKDQKDQKDKKEDKTSIRQENQTGKGRYKDTKGVH